MDRPTTQIAPTILRALGLDPEALDGVRLEGTHSLPDLSKAVLPDNENIRH